MSENPFTLVDNVKPKFPKSKQIFFARVSDEARNNIKVLADQYTGGNTSELFELIGLFQLSVVKDYFVTDPNSNTNTEDCRQAGYEDGLEGNPQRFLILYGNAGTPFEQAYKRGYMEGNFIRNNGKK